VGVRHYRRKGHPATKNFVIEFRPCPGDAPREITELLAAWGNGDENALSGLMPMVYPELRRIARKHLSSGFQTLESAALANEAYLKLIRAQDIRCESRV
jgi:RNA polymerase sigma-70 factor, ECF subfamily